MLGFTSDRKRMSVILRTEDGIIKIICKGADTTMLPRLRSDYPKEKQVPRGCVCWSGRCSAEWSSPGVCCVADMYEQREEKKHESAVSATEQQQPNTTLDATIACFKRAVVCKQTNAHSALPRSRSARLNPRHRTNENRCERTTASRLSRRR